MTSPNASTATSRTHRAPRVALKGSTGSPFARVLGFGSYRPRRRVDNEEMCRIIDSTPEWIEQRSGIIERRWASDDETLLYMCTEAGKMAMERAGITGDQVGAVILATVTWPVRTPAGGPQVAAALGANGAPAYDQSAGCAGFCYGLTQAEGLVRSGAAEYVVVIGADRLTDITDFQDRSSAFLLADGAGAAVVGPSDTPGMGPAVWGSDGEASGVMGMTPTADGSELKFHMQGRDVFKWACTYVARQSAEMLEKAGIGPEDLDVFIPHQANNRIIDAMMRTLRLPEHITVARDIKYQGNTSSASVPLAIERLYDDNLVESGQTALIMGFGAGLCYAGQVIQLP